MPPKPFPFPLGVGVDIANISRFKKLAENPFALNRWAQKTFNRLEWPDLLEVFRPQEVQAKDTLKDTSANEPQSQFLLPKIHPPVSERVMSYLAGRLVPKDSNSYTLRVEVYSLILVLVVLGGP